MRIIISFYQLFFWTSFFISLSCGFVIYTWGIATFSALFWFKITTMGAVGYYMKNAKSSLFYYFKNLGISKKKLWIVASLIDILLFTLIVIVAIIAR
ncbi:hypothetical protein EMN47_16485 [Prolixibacteraceae bacterium JC049]|nr:hypothetical protein [Prolixibacteraceae bacterium JC049]